MVKLVHSRLLFGDFISDDAEEKEIKQKLNTFGFRTEQHKDNMPLKSSTRSLNTFIDQLRSTCTSDTELLDYVKNIVFWINDDGTLPLKVIIIEVILKTEDLQKLEKADLESKTWKLSLLLGNCFSEGSLPLSNHSEDFHILKFSSLAINIPLRNFVAEFIIEAESKFFDEFNKELNSLEDEILKRDQNRKEQKIIEAARQEKYINKMRTNIISMEPVSFLEDRFSHDQSIVRGYANMTSIIGKIVQESLWNSPALYLSVLSMEEKPLEILENMPVLQLPDRHSLLDFSFGAGQILALQLLNSWNRHVETSIKKITTKQNSAQVRTNMDANKTLEELRDLIFNTGMDEKILVNYRKELHDLADSSKKTFLYEFPMPPKEGTLYSENPGKYGLEKSGPLASNLASLILKDIDLNEKHLLDATAFRKSKLDVLKIEEGRKHSRMMLYLTIVIAASTIVNVILFLARII